jgi:signal transduction histidine kinase
MGQLAAGIALQVLGNSRASDQTLQTNLVIRSSCGCRITPSKTFEATNQMPDAVRKRHQQKREHHLRMIGVRLLGASDDQDIKSILHEGLSNLETGRVTVCIIPETSRGSSAKKAVVFYDYQNPASRKILSEKEFLLDRVFPPDYDTEDANFLVCPLNFGNENLGYIIFEHDPEILEVYYILSLQLGNAVKVWELEKKRRDYTDNLKHLVETRTEELLVEARLRQKAESEILAAAEREQRRIGQDLHDDICQRLAAISILAGALERMNSDKSLANSASVISERIRDVIEKTKSLSRGLFPVVLEKQGLCGALEELCSIQKKLSALPCDFIHEEKNGRYEPSRETSLHLYRIAQEAVNNAVHHGGGPITVTLSESSESLVLSIRDQGKGFLPDTPSGMGLPSMKHRSLLIQAKLIIESCANGTTVECSLEKRGMQK